MSSLIAFFFMAWNCSAAPLIDQLKSIVEMNSGSANLAGVDNVQSWIGGELKGLGFTIDLGTNHLLIATLKGRTPKIVTFIVHADTVFEPSSPFQHFSVEGQIARGPGVIDDKGGVLVALEGLRRFLKNPPEFTLKFVSSPAEETGSSGLLDTFHALAKESSLVLSFEPALDDGSIVHSRRGNRWYNTKVLGKEAHAGRAHKDGANACVDLAIKLAEISKFTNYAKDVTVSVGHIEGGQDKYNIVCGNAEAKLDTRFSQDSEGRKLHAKIDKVLKRVDVKGTTTSYEIANASPAFSLNRNTHPFLDQYLASLKQVEGKAVAAEKSGGSADSNNFSRPGAVILDGLGPVGGKMHTADEFLNIASLESRAEALNQFLSHLTF